LTTRSSLARSPSPPLILMPETLIQRAAQVLLIGDRIDRAIAVIGPIGEAIRQQGRSGCPAARPSTSRTPYRGQTPHADQALPAEQSERASIAAIRSNGATFLPTSSSPICSINCTSGSSVSRYSKDVGASANALIVMTSINTSGAERSPEGVFHRPRIGASIARLDAANGRRA